MERYHKVMVFLAYVFGVFSFLGLLVNDHKKPLYTFHLWQAFFFNLIIAIVSVVVYGWWAPKYLMTVAVEARTSVLLNMTLIPIISVMLLSIVLGILASMEYRFRIPGLAPLADRLTK